MAEDPLELVGSTLEGGFCVDSFAEEGELIVTYRGHDPIGAHVAVRCLNLPMTLDPGLASPFVERFQERTRVYRRLAPGNTNFVQILGAGTATAKSTGRTFPYEIREWLDAMTFATYCAKRRSEGHEGWEIGDVLDVLGPVAQGLGYAHEMGFTHAEVNPNNLLVAEIAGRPVLKILDFGEARAAGDKVKDGPVLRVLVPEYAAPELVDKQLGAIGTWTDVFSLAVIVLECLAGTLATRNVAASVIVDPKHRPSARKLGLTLPKRVDEVLERALASEPARRPKDVAAFWRELTAAAVPVPVPVLTPPRASAAPSSSSVPIRSPTARPVPPLPPRAPTVRPAPPNLIKATLVGLHPTRLAELARAQPLEPEFSSDEAPTKPRDEPHDRTDGAAVSPPARADAVLADMRSAPRDEVPEVFLPALLRPTLGMRVRLAFVWAREVATLAGLHAWPWLAARARDRTPRGRAVLGGSLFGGVLLLALGSNLCLGRGPAKSGAAVTSAPNTPTTGTPSAGTQGATAPTAQASTAAEVPAEPPATAPSPTAPMTPAPTTPAPTTPFTRAQANLALETAGGDLSECQTLGALHGPGSIRASFNKSGGVARISIGPPYADTPEGACILNRFGRAQMAPFRGAPGAVNYVFNVPK